MTAQNFTCYAGQMRDPTDNHQGWWGSDDWDSRSESELQAECCLTSRTIQSSCNTGASGNLAITPDIYIRSDTGQFIGAESIGFSNVEADDDTWSGNWDADTSKYLSPGVEFEDGSRIFALKKADNTYETLIFVEFASDPSEYLTFRVPQRYPTSMAINCETEIVTISFALGTEALLSFDELNLNFVQ